MICDWSVVCPFYHFISLFPDCGAPTLSVDCNGLMSHCFVWSSQDPPCRVRKGSKEKHNIPRLKLAPLELRWSFQGFNKDLVRQFVRSNWEGFLLRSLLVEWRVLATDWHWPNLFIKTLFYVLFLSLLLIYFIKRSVSPIFISSCEATKFSWRRLLKLWS